MAKTKRCTKCGVEKPLSCFCHKTKSKDGYNCHCKECVHKYQTEHAAHIKEYMLDYERNKRKDRSAYMEKYRELHRDKAREVSKEWYYTHLDEAKRYRAEHRDHYNGLARRYRKDQLVAFKKRVRGLVHESFARKGMKKFGKTEELVGCSIEQLREHLLSTWRLNYGTEWNGEPYHIDHIKPLATADTEEEVVRLCDWKNLQMLTPRDNQIKGGK